MEKIGYRHKAALYISLFSFALMPACARKEVYIPPEYRSSSPQTGYSTHQPPSGYQAQQGPEGPGVVRTPDFKKQDIPASPGPPPPIVRQPAPIPEHPPVKPAPKGPAVAKPQPAPKPQPVPENKKETAKSPQHQASMQLVSQAKGPLERGKPDTAIPMLEKAIQIDSQNPEAFLLLARAWKQKQARQKSLEFARKAELLYHGKPSKLKEVYQLESDLYREMGDSAKAAKYKKKASSVGEKPAKAKAGPAQ